MSYASRTLSGEARVTLAKESGEYGIKVWEAIGPDGAPSMAEIIVPDHGELAKLGNKTGTAVILHGDGSSSTWSQTMADRVHRYLAERYFTFPNDVRVQTRGPEDPRRRLVVPYGHLLASHNMARGVVEFSDVKGLSGQIRWWLLNDESGAGKRPMRPVRPQAGIGLLVGNKIFPFGGQYLEDFGIWLKPAKRRVVFLIEVAGAEMDSARAGVFFPGANGDRQNVPWKALGRHFIENMPAEIAEITRTSRRSQVAINKKLADILDMEWWKKLNPVRLGVPTAKGPLRIGTSAAGDSSRLVRSAAAERAEREEKKPNAKEPEVAPTRRHAVGQRTGGGDKPGRWGERVVLPAVKFVPHEEFPDDEHPYGITWDPVGCTVLVSDQFKPYVREVGRWVESTTLPRDLVVAAIRQACATEYAALIIDANGQDKHGLKPHLVEGLKDDNALFSKVLGRVSLPVLIQQYLDEAQKEVA